MAAVHKLVAVVIADVVGYSRLMERDESGTHERLLRLRAELIVPKIAEHGGRTVKTTGDGMLLEFPSATSALRCAVEVQRAMGVRNLYVPADERVDLRVGINIGDVIVDDDDIIGDGVNVAARLETLAEPGGINVSAAVVEQVHEDLGIEFIDSGEHLVKNLTKPTHMFRVVLGKGLGEKTPLGAISSAAEPAPRRGRFGVSRPWAIGVAGAFVLAAMIAATWRIFPHSAIGEKAADEPPAHSVMVAPFDAAGDAALERAAGQISSEITRSLAASMPDMRVTPAASAAVLVAKATDARAAGRDANVRYVIQGDLLPIGTQVAATLRIVDTRDGTQIKTERLVIDRAQLDNHDALTRQLTYSARIMLREAILRAVPKSGGATSAQELVDRARALSTTDPVVRAHEMRRLADQAIHLDPDLSDAWSQRVMSNIELFENDFTVDRQRVLAEAEADSLRAVALGPRDPSAWWARAIVLGYRGNLDAAVAANDRALDIDPTRLTPIILRGWLYLYAGKPAEALKVVDSLESRLGNMESEPQIMACEAHLALGAYADAIRACERASASDNSWAIFANLAAAHALRGDLAEAGQARARLLEVRPDFTIARYEAKLFSSSPEALAIEKTHLIAGMRTAGVPD